MYCTFARFEEVKQLKVEQLLLSEGDVVVTFRKGKTYQMGEARKAVIPGGVYEGFNSTKVLKAYLYKLKNIELKAMKPMRVIFGSTVRRYATLSTPLLKRAAMAAL